MEERMQLPNFGIGYLNVQEAADLAANCMFWEGHFDIEYEPEDNIARLDDIKLQPLLKSSIKNILEKLLKGIEAGTLKAVTQRNLDETINIEKTLIDCDDLYNWFKERGVDLGEHYTESYLDGICDLYSKVGNLLEQEYYKNKLKKEDIKEIFEDKDRYIAYLTSRLQSLEEQIKTNTPQKAEKPLHPKSRNSLLTMIIAMGIKGYRYNPQKSKNEAISEIVSDIELLGLSLTDDAVRKWLQEASELLPIEALID